MLDAGINSARALEELEAHLREETQQRAQSGDNLQAAFEAAVGQVGQAAELGVEFGKLGVMREAKRWKLVGIAFSLLAVGISIRPIYYWLAVPKLRAAFSVTDRILVIAAVATGLLSVLGWHHGRKFLPVIGSRRLRIAIGTGCCLLGVCVMEMIWLFVFPLLGHMRAQLFTVLITWSWTAMAILGGVGYGLAMAASPASQSQPPSLPLVPRRFGASAQIFEEVRLLLWPWCLMTLASLVPLMKFVLPDQRSDWPVGIAVFGFFGGAAILTALSFGRALPARVSMDDDVSPREGWTRKMGVLTAAMICTGLIACVVQTVLGNIRWHELNANAIEPILLLTIIVCSTGFWTLLTRSIMGGLILTGLAQFALYLLVVLFASTIDRMAPAIPGAVRLSHEPEVHAALSWFVGGFGLSYAAIMLWLSRRKFAAMQLSDSAPNKAGIKSFIQSFSAITEFCLVISICFGLTIVVTSVWLIRQLSHAPPAPYNQIIHLRNNGAVVSVVLELVTLGIVLWIGRIRGWSLATFGLRFSWKGTGAGVLLFLAFFVIQQLNALLTRLVFHGTVDFHRVSNMTIPCIILLSIVNPLAEEAIESGYIFHALQRYGMWITVLAAAVFRGYLHATMGVSGFVTMFAMGLLYGFVYWRWRLLWPLMFAHALQMLYALIPQAQEIPR